MSTVRTGFSYYEFTGDGVTNTYVIQFDLGVLKKSFVTCQVNNEVDGAGNPVYRELTFIPGDAGMVQIGGDTPSLGAPIVFRRIVPKDLLLHLYSNGSILDYPSLDESLLQLMMAVHEILDGFGLANIYTDINMHGFKIVGVNSDSTNPTSVVTFEKLQEFSADVQALVTLGTPDGASLVGYTQDRPGATVRTVQAKLQDVVSVKDFGAVGDGVTDDTAAIHAAINSGARKIVFPDGKYKVTSTLVLSTNGQELCGEGGSYFFDWQNPASGSVLLWAGGADEIVRVTPGALNKPIFGVRIHKLVLDGQSIATNGLYVEAASNCVFDEIGVTHCTDAAVKTGVCTTEGYIGLNMVHSCVFNNLFINQYLVGDGAGLHLFGGQVGDSSGTTTVCTFSNVKIFHRNGNGLTITLGDTNFFYNLAVSRSSQDPEGTGIGIELMGVEAFGDNTWTVNANCFFGVSSGPGGIISRNGTAASANGNIVYGLLIDNGCPQPIIESPSKFKYYTSYDATTFGDVLSETNVLIKALSGSGLAFTADSSATFGVDLYNGSFPSGQIRLKPNTAGLVSRNNANTANISVLRVNNLDELAIEVDSRISDGKNINTATTTGTKIAASATQKLGLWGATPVAQYATTGVTSGFTAGVGNAAKDDSTYTGGFGAKAYTVTDIVRALKLAGIIAS